MREDFLTNTKILIQNGFIYEVGLIKKATTTEEDKSILENQGVLGSSVENELGFLFRLDDHSLESGVKDIIKNYTGVIENYENGEWV